MGKCVANKQNIKKTKLSCYPIRVDTLSILIAAIGQLEQGEVSCTIINTQGWLCGHTVYVVTQGPVLRRTLSLI